MFTFRQFAVDDSMTAMKVGTDGVLLGAWGAGGTSILDIGTGSGLIALMMAQRFPQALVTAIDIDADACRQAVANAAASPFGSRITVVNASLQDFAATAMPQSFDAIVSNPPYFQNSLLSPDARRTAARHTASLSFRDLMGGARRLLADGGVMSVIGPADAESDMEGEAIISGMSVAATVAVSTRQGKRPRRFMARLVNGPATTYDHSDVILTASDGRRSEWYHELTKEFYIR